VVVLPSAHGAPVQDPNGPANLRKRHRTYNVSAAPGTMSEESAGPSHPIRLHSPGTARSLVRQDGEGWEPDFRAAYGCGLKLKVRPKPPILEPTPTPRLASPQVRATFRQQSDTLDVVGHRKQIERA
jgi:hypothetical protein